MQLAIFGATGPTGQEVVQQALQTGYQVNALVRRPLDLTHPRLTVLTGDITDKNAVKGVVKHSDAVLSVLGSSPTLFGPKSTTIYSKSAAAFVGAMAELSVKRLIFCTSAGVEDDPGEIWFYKHVLKPLILQPSYDDMHRAEDLIARSNLDWVVVRPSRLIDGPSERQVRVSGRFRPKDGTTVSRSDVARFMLQQLTNSEWIHRTPTLAY